MNSSNPIIYNEILMFFNNFVDEFASEYLHDLALSHYLQWKSKVFNYTNRQQSATQDPFETSEGASYIVFYSVC